MSTTRIIRTPALLLGVIALLLAGLTLPAQAATRTAAVKGVVTLDGKPLKGLKIELYATGTDGYEGPRQALDTTNSKGAYSARFAPINPIDGPLYYGTTVVISDPQGRIVKTTRKFKGVAGKTVTRNASVKAAGSITGTVARGDGRPTQQLRVDVEGPDVQVDEDSDLLAYDEHLDVAADGTFTLTGLPTGDYRLQFSDDSQTYFSQCYDNVPAPSSYACTVDDEDTPGDAIHVSPGEHVTLEPQVLSNQGRRISGIVTDTSGRPVRNVSVTATQDGGPGKGGDIDHPTTGAFRIGPLPEGSYRLTADAVYPWASASLDTSLDATAGDVTGVTIQLKSQATIKATLTPGTGTVKVTVDVTRSATGSKPSGKTTIRWGTVSKTVDLVKGKGTVKLSGLPKGKRQITVSYAGTSSTAATTKLFYATVK